MSDENSTNETTETTEETPKGTKINWSKVALRDAHGAVDIDATIALCTEELTALQTSEVDPAEINEAIAASKDGSAVKPILRLMGEKA